VFIYSGVDHNAWLPIHAWTKHVTAFVSSADEGVQRGS
jgi:hypothetical protein